MPLRSNFTMGNVVNPADGAVKALSNVGTIMQQQEDIRVKRADLELRQQAEARQQAVEFRAKESYDLINNQRTDAIDLSSLAVPTDDGMRRAGDAISDSYTALDTQYGANTNTPEYTEERNKLDDHFKNLTDSNFSNSSSADVETLRGTMEAQLMATGRSTPTEAAATANAEILRRFGNKVLSPAQLLAAQKNEMAYLKILTGNGKGGGANINIGVDGTSVNGKTVTTNKFDATSMNTFFEKVLKVPESATILGTAGITTVSGKETYTMNEINNLATRMSHDKVSQDQIEQAFMGTSNDGSRTWPIPNAGFQLPDNLDDPKTYKKFVEFAKGFGTDNRTTTKGGGSDALIQSRNEEFIRAHRLRMADLNAAAQLGDKMPKSVTDFQAIKTTGPKPPKNQPAPNTTVEEKPEVKKAVTVKEEVKASNALKTYLKTLDKSFSEKGIFPDEINKNKKKDRELLQKLQASIQENALNEGITATEIVNKLDLGSTVKDYVSKNLIPYSKKYDPNEIPLGVGMRSGSGIYKNPFDEVE